MSVSRRFEDYRTPVPADHDLLPPELAGFERVAYMPPRLGRAQNERIGSFRDAYLVGRHPLAFSASGEILSESIFRTEERIERAVASLTRRDRLAVRFPRWAATQRIPGRACLLASGWDHFGHWIPEHLLKVRSLEEQGVDTSEVTFVVRSPQAAFRRDLLAAAGVGPDRITVWHGGRALVEELLVPDYPEITAARLRWVCELGTAGSRGAIAGSPRVHLSRQRQRSRVIVNITEVEEALSRNGFITVRPEDLPFAEQVAIAQSANVLFGPQGSAFTLQIFMPPGGSIVEAFGRDRVHLFNRQVATVIGHRHHALPDPRGPIGTDPPDSSVVVDIGALEQILSRLDDHDSDRPGVAPWPRS